MQVGTCCDRKSFKWYKKEAIRAARDFKYSKECLDRLEAATTEGEIERAMRFGRKEKFGD